VVRRDLLTKRFDRRPGLRLEPLDLQRSKRFDHGVLRSGARPTIKDVARRAEVSFSTVSAVLNATAPTSQATRLRVLAAVAELGYEPNSQARNLKRSRSHAIGLIVPDVLNPFFALVAEGIGDEARRRDYVLVLCSTDSDADREASYARLLRARRLDGVIHLSGTGLPPAALLELASSAAVVTVDERVPGLPGPFVGSDNRRGARLAAELALAHGHRRFGIVAGPTGLWTAEQRLAGHREALAAAGLDPDAVPMVRGDYRLESGRAAAAVLLAERPTVLLVANDLMAVGCLQHLLSVGVDVPREVSVVGYDDIPLATVVTPTLTTVSQPAREMGRVAAELLLDGIDGREVPESFDLEPTVVERESLAEVPA
jgi:DNA-binding LacI/PurR family transcriptional regulator